MASRGKQWSEIVSETLIELWGEENVRIALNNAKTSKHSSAIYNSIWVSDIKFIQVLYVSLYMHNDIESTLCYVV
jgi:hypothetical protein